MSCPQIWNIEQEKDREKEKVGRRPAKLKEKNDKGENFFLLEEQHKTFVAEVTKRKMLAATNARGNEWQ